MYSHCPSNEDDNKVRSPRSKSGYVLMHRWNVALLILTFAAGSLFGEGLRVYRGASLESQILKTLSVLNATAAVAAGNEPTIPVELKDINAICEALHYRSSDDETNAATKSLALSPPAGASWPNQESPAWSPAATGMVKTTQLRTKSSANDDRKQDSNPSNGDDGNSVGDYNDGPAPSTSTTKQRKNLTVNQKSGWCPRAKCLETDLCSPCTRRYLIVLTMPRAASTTLTWMLDSLPGIRMSGENGNTLGRIKSMVDNVVKDANFFHSTNKRAPWGHNFMPNQTLSCVSQQMIESINPPVLKKKKYIAWPAGEASEIVGFKTIRYLISDTKTVAQEREWTEFLLDHFPCSRVLINVNSDVEGQVHSIEKAFHSTNETKVTGFIEEGSAKLRRLAARLGSDRAFLLDKNEWTQNVTYLNEAVSWLGFKDECHFQELLEFNTGGSGYGNGRTTLRMSNKCKRL